jgi:hypothetical protein
MMVIPFPFVGEGIFVRGGMPGMKKTGWCIGVIFLLVSLCGYSGADGKSAGGEKDITPGAPTALKLVIVPNGFKLTWKLSPQDPGIVTGYEIVRSDRASGPFDNVASVDKEVSEYIDTTASKEIIYYYKVRAKAGNVDSPYSNTVTGER